ncbi:hypothetical protein CJD36_009425 [Flavipsychrobacter stenotrophus]|uniref:Peptidase M56 domain-containing protein n=1 Tax=Flavipsychrobacter stenotrophus TaxID=2077091 RepID=A0A2S7SYJ6_9BACT|nr:M56 family metallopeptidase [Flavipsychrobacter stenotrophus]PQJ11999.1 hypothetical protein CJD36_009425 [Flavipsychrobacter stenotrophus]
MATIIFTSLLQSLWLGLLLAATTAMVLLVTRNSKPQFRYILLTACLFLFAVVMAIVILAGVSHLLTAGAQCVAESGTPVPAANPLSHTMLFSLTGIPFVTALIQYASYIAWIWLAIVIAKTLQMTAGLYRLTYMRRKEVFVAGKWWEEKVVALSGQLGIDRKVNILQSGLANAPMVIGYLKPLILLPVGLINHLPAAEVEAIICHELAHIRRKDYLVNLFQTVMEVLFFFNPAVLWLNQLIRKERENCCDDIAMAANVSIQDYLSALVACREYQLGVYNSCALAFAGNKNDLTQRVKRLIGQNKKNTAGRLFLALLAIATLALALAFSLPDGLGKHTTRIRIETPEMKKEIETIDMPVAADNSKCSNEAEPIAHANDQTALEVAPVALAVPATEKEAFSEADGDKMNEELRTDRIISSTVNTSYELDEHKLVVNSITQPIAIHK